MKPTMCRPGRCLWTIVLLITAGFVLAVTGVEAVTLRVMTYNIHHGADADGRVDLARVAETIRTYDPDVAFLSEVDQHWRRSGLVDQPAVLAAATGMPFSHYAPALDSRSLWVTSPGRRARYGNLILSKQPWTQASAVPLPRVGKNEPRNVLWIDLRLDDGQPIRIFGTHLSVDPRERREQLEALRELVASSPHPAILVGDFNSPPDRLKTEAPYLWSSPWYDAHTAAGTGPGFTFPVPMPTTRIDYIFVHERLLPYLSDSMTPHSQASDHLPVMIELSALRPRDNLISQDASIAMMPAPGDGRLDRVLEQHGDGHRAHAPGDRCQMAGDFLHLVKCDVAHQPAVGQPVDADVDDGGPRLNILRRDQPGTADRDHEEIRAPAHTSKLGGARMSQGDRGVFM